MPILPRPPSKGDMAKIRKTSINSNDVDLTTTLLINTKEPLELDHIPLTPSTPIPTIYPNDYDFDIENSLKSKLTSRSFIRPPKTLSQEHRNKSLPHNLQV